MKTRETHHTTSEPSGKDWMSWMDDGLLMSSISIPGTHDSAAYTYRVPFIATQRLDLQQQLDAGIRYFDLRCGLRADVLEMVHGPSLLGIRLEMVLSLIYQWLDAHPSEALIVQLKQDREDDSSSISFSQAVVDMIKASSQYWLTSNTTPSLGALRGKIQLFRRFRGPAVSAFGLNVSRWQDNPKKPFTMDVGHNIRVTVQDHYKYEDAEPLPSLVDHKLAEIVQMLRMAGDNKDDSQWYVNFTSALEFNWSYRYPPQEIAEGGWFGFKRVRGVNDGLCEYIQAQKHRARYGILAMDFPDSNKELIRSLILSNFCQRSAISTTVRTITLILLAATLSCFWLYKDHASSLEWFIVNVIHS